jgi:hypothetical protein
MYGAQQAAVGAAVDYAGSPAAVAEQQARWEKERVENLRLAYQGQVAHFAMSLLTSVNGHQFTPEKALEAADKVLRGARSYAP